MIIGKWNRSVFLTYLGLVISVSGMHFAWQKNFNLAFVCLMAAGICDLFDGVVARKVKRTETEKKFGAALDSLVDVINFTLFPVVLFLALGFQNGYQLVLYCFYTICQVARLAHFDTLEDTPQKQTTFTGLPVAYSALILPLVYPLLQALPAVWFKNIFCLLLFVMACLNILNIKIAKPRGMAYLIFALLAVVMTFVYLVVL